MLRPSGCQHLQQDKVRSYWRKDLATTQKKQKTELYLVRKKRAPPNSLINDMVSIKILQHNVLHWPTRISHLTNMYLNIKPDIILINSHGLRGNENINIQGYNIYTKNN